MKHLYGLDLLRFAAATLVVFHHLHGFGLSAGTFPAPVADRAFPWLPGWTEFGWIGVQIFFVISGFVIAASALGSTPQSFLVRRAIRVFPALWICSAIAAVMMLTGGEPIGATLAAFARSTVLSPIGPYVDAVLWTLVVEAVFYGFIALLLAIWGGTVPVFERAAYTLGLASAAFLLAEGASRALPLTLGGLDISALLDRYQWSLTLLRHGVFFAIGMMAWIAHREGWSPRRAAAVALWIGCGAIQITLTAQLSAAAILPIAAFAIALALAWASLRLGFEIRDRNRADTVRQFGLMTYPLYLGHFTFGTFLIPLIAPGLPTSGLLFATTLAAIFGTAWLVLRFPERWLQTWAKSTLTGREMRPAR